MENRWGRSREQRAESREQKSENEYMNFKTP